MTWRYETISLNEVHRLLDEQNHVHPDYNILKIISKKSYEVAKVFEEKGMNEEFIVKYLNNQLPCDVLCEFGLITSVLYPSDIPIEDRTYSYSHSKWLNVLSRTKLHWTWEQPDIKLEETQRNKLQSVLDTYNELQQLALSYKYE